MRLLALVGIILVAVWLPFWACLLCALVYAFFYFAWDLVLVGICIDILFGIGLWPYYALCIGVIVYGIELLRPKLSVQ